MYICYVDESGGFEAPNAYPNATPLMVLAGLIIRADLLGSLTADFIDLKKQYKPTKDINLLDHVLIEIKGSELRKFIRTRSRRKQRYAIGVLDKVVSLLEKYEIRLVGRIWVKESGTQLRPRESYTLSVQNIAEHFNNFLKEKSSQGIILCDGREPSQDSQVAHSIFTQKHKRSGDAIPNLIETPLFGRSQNHIGIQLADMIASGILFPIAARVYCSEDLNSIHVHPSYEILRSRYSTRIHSIQYFYRDTFDRRRGGIVVSDKLNRQPSRLIFAAVTPQGNI